MQKVNIYIFKYIVTFVLFKILFFLGNFKVKNSDIQTFTSNNSGQNNDYTEDSHKVENGIIENDSEYLSPSESM